MFSQHPKRKSVASLFTLYHRSLRHVSTSIPFASFQQQVGQNSVPSATWQSRLLPYSKPRPNTCPQLVTYSTSLNRYRSQHRPFSTKPPEPNTASRTIPPIAPVEPIDPHLARALSQLEPMSMELPKSSRFTRNSSIPAQMDETMLTSMQSIQSTHSTHSIHSTALKQPKPTGVTGAAATSVSAITTTTPTPTTAPVTNPSRWSKLGRGAKTIILLVGGFVLVNITTAVYAQYSWSHVAKLFHKPDALQQDIVEKGLSDLYEDISILSSIYRCEMFHPDDSRENRKAEFLGLQKLLLKHLLIQQQLLALIDQSLLQVRQVEIEWGEDEVFLQRLAPYHDDLHELDSTLEDLRRVITQRSFELIYLYHKRFNPDDDRVMMYFFQEDSAVNIYNIVLKSFEIIYRVKLDLRRAVNFLLYMNSIRNDHWWNTAPHAMKHNFQGIFSFCDELAYEQFEYPEGNNFYPFFENNSLLVKQLESFTKFSEKNNTSVLINSASLQPSEILALTPPQFGTELIDHLTFPSVTMEDNHPGSLIQPSSDTTQLIQNDDHTPGSLQKSPQFSLAKFKGTVNINPDRYPKGSVGSQRNVPRTDWLYTPTPKLPSYTITKAQAELKSAKIEDGPVTESIFTRFSPKSTANPSLHQSQTDLQQLSAQELVGKKGLQSALYDPYLPTAQFDLQTPDVMSLLHEDRPKTSQLDKNDSSTSIRRNPQHHQPHMSPSQPFSPSQRYLHNGQVLKSPEAIKQETIDEMLKQNKQQFE